MIKIYGKTQCAACNTAKSICTAKGVDFEYLTFGKDYDFDLLLEIAPNQKAFPIITVDDKFIGGLGELQQYLKA